MTAARARRAFNRDKVADTAAAFAVVRAEDWLAAARIAVDERMGEGAADEQPALVAGFVVAAALAYRAEVEWTHLALEQNP